MDGVKKSGSKSAVGAGNERMYGMKLGFIGTGNMALAIIGGVLKKRLISAGDIMGADPLAASRDKAKETFGIRVTADNIEAVKFADILFLSVKPQYYESVITGIRDAADERQLIVTIAPGKSLVFVEKVFAKNMKIIRVMPNTPALVGEGMSALCPNRRVTDEELKYVRDIFESFGKAEIIPEKLMDVAVSVSGSSPAYVFMMIEAMADAAVSGGMPRTQAYEFAAQAVMGSAKMVLETGKHPGELKDMVCSPAGTTVEAVRELERRGFRSAIIEAMKVCEKKAKEC